MALRGFYSPLVEDRAHDCSA